MPSDAQVIVIGVDFGPRGDDAIALGLDLAARDPDVVLHAVHALAPSGHASEQGDTPGDALHRALALGPERVLRRVSLVAAMRDEPALPRHAHPHALVGEPAHVLCRVALEFGAHLIVVGTQDRQGISRWFHRSVAGRLVHQAPCPLLIARPRSAGAELGVDVR
jgi:nucleotide-binding universal stress UspA family protein